MLTVTMWTCWWLPGLQCLPFKLKVTTEIYGLLLILQKSLLFMTNKQFVYKRHRICTETSVRLKEDKVLLQAGRYSYKLHCVRLHPCGPAWVSTCKHDMFSHLLLTALDLNESHIWKQSAINASEPFLSVSGHTFHTLPQGLDHCSWSEVRGETKSC